MNRQQSLTKLLRQIVDALLSVEANRDGRAIINVSPIRVQLWAEELQDMLQPKRRGAPKKSTLHVHWAMQYWTHRLYKPADIAGAIRAVQAFSKLRWPQNDKPNATTIKREVRKHRGKVFELFERDSSVPRHLLKALRDYLTKHEHVGNDR